MKRKLDFIIDDYYDERLLFRFYPKSSHVHGFGEECPKSWDKVYKVYYSWSIIKQYKFEEDEKWEIEKLFSLDDDECSEFVNLDYYINDVLENKKDAHIVSCGQPSSEWNIYYSDKYIEIQVWDTWSNK